MILSKKPNDTRALVFRSKRLIANEVGWMLNPFVWNVLKIGGVMINLNMDDFSGKCKLQEYPFTEMIGYHGDCIPIHTNTNYSYLKTIGGTVQRQTYQYFYSENGLSEHRTKNREMLQIANMTVVPFMKSRHS